MGKNDLKVVLEIEKESANHENEMFYRYRIGDFKLWFSQDNDTGNIYSVGFVEDGRIDDELELKDFDFSIYANEYGRDGYYPNQFEIRPRSYPMTTQDAYEFMVKMRKACRILDTVEEFFATSKHYELYAKHHFSGEKSVSVEAFPAEGGNALYAQTYPVESQDEALKMFREAHPEYKGCILVAENVYGKDASVEEKKEDELISREALMSDIVSYNLKHGRSWASMDDDWRKAWEIIATFCAEDGDLVSRAGLLDAVVSQFGCDLAYYDGDLRFIQEAIELIPAVSVVKVDDLIVDASARSGAENKTADIAKSSTTENAVALEKD